MIRAIVAAVAEGVLVLLSLRASRRFNERQRLHMEWSMNGSVNWTAPRPLALAFTPILAGVIFTGMVWLTTTQTPRPGQGWLVIPALAFVALVFVGAHAFHLWLIRNSIGRSD